MRVSSLFPRILIAIVFIPILIFVILYKDPIYYYVVVSIAIILALIEFFSMMSKRGIKPMWIIGIALGVSFLLYPAFIGVNYSMMFLTIGILITLLIKILKVDYETHVPSLFMTIFGVIYICWIGNFIIQVRYSLGSSLTLFLFAITWMNDTGAYFIGSLIGKHKLLPKVSPNKTVEGLIGGIIFSLLTGIILKPFLMKSVSFVGDISNLLWIVICLLLSIVAHTGDLAESLLKRYAGQDKHQHILLLPKSMRLPLKLNIMLSYKKLIR